MIDFLRGNKREAIAFLQADDADSSKNGHILGFDFYSGFTLKGQVRKYFGFGEFLSPSYKSRMREGMRLFTKVDPLTQHFSQPRKFWERSTDNCTSWVDCRNTDNLRAMRDSSVYLMAEEAGNERTLQIYKDRIRLRVRSLYMIGQGEWDSPIYLGHTITSYVNLYDFAKDEEVRAIAKSALDWFFVTGALKYWRGGFGGPSKRDNSGGNCAWCSGASRALGLYFGDSPVKDNSQDTDLIHLITSSYRPPAAAVALAQKQFTKPLELLNSKPQYENWKPGKSDKPEFHETLYFGHTFQLGTLAQGSGGDWNGFKLMAFNSHRGIDYFIPTSSSGNNAVGQYQNLAIWLNDANSSFQFFLPKSAHTEIKRGKLFIKLEKTWLAITPLSSANAPINLQFGVTKDVKNYPNDHILTASAIGEGISGFVLEVGEGESWEQFKYSVLGSQLKIDNQTAEYISSKKIRVQHQGRSLPKVWRNGKLHDWGNHFDVYQSDKPLIHQGWKSKSLNLSILDGQHQKLEFK
ncbi:hypothetical protein Nos7524_5670 (plasmid) [Nostoc sp. PCC 7524]|uniref:hypothetical protein n=1 Tax=Nostoc sp. (strain ATCC 29411 / PCC 7524) TaxID=28072 RepID=UPI00029F1655|nr:hypothetical protein Nos7524_5670 [Nostoc sp. PCC 7524]